MTQAAQEFLEYATNHPDDEFYLTKVGCGIAGLTEWQMLRSSRSASKRHQNPQAGTNEESPTAKAIKVPLHYIRQDLYP